MISFRVQVADGHARAGVLQTPRGAVLTPAFMPVGTQATVKALSPDEVSLAGARILIANTYHLWLRPGAETVSRMGGLAAFMRWPHAIVTDSGGYQAFSLAERTTVKEEGFEFSSHLDGTRLLLSPEESMRVQGLLGADIAMQLDICAPVGADPEALASACARTTRWAKRCLEARRRDQALFGIVQGGLNLELRAAHAAELSRLPLDGLALGGFSVGEPPSEMHGAVVAIAPRLDPARPRYLMGVGTPEDIVIAIGAGVDLFDCVLPTRNARNGQVFTRDGKIGIRNARHRDDPGPLEPGCPCPCCAGGFSRAYLRHLFVANEILAHRLLSLHNVFFYQGVVAEARRAVELGAYGDWASGFLERWRPRERA